MSNPELSKEERILKIMKRVLTDVAKDTHVTPGIKHPLSEQTVQGIRECLGLITSREAELAEKTGRNMNMRPRYVDEAPKEVVVKLDLNAGKKKKD
ncbi:MAG: segregation and condensation protein A [Gammaproteobacteria bacterium]